MPSLVFAQVGRSSARGKRVTKSESRWQVSLPEWEGDGTLHSLCTQLVEGCDRTLLLVIADRCDDLLYGSGEGWRKLHKYKKVPATYYSTCYWSRRPLGNLDFFCNWVFPPQWFYRVYANESRISLTTLFPAHNIADFSNFPTAYTVAAAEWYRLSEDGKKEAEGVFQ